MALGLGEGSNNFVELRSLKFLIIFTIEKECNHLFVFGDSRGTQNCMHIRLENIMEEIKQLKNSLDSFSCRHVYRELNKEADRRSRLETRASTGIGQMENNRNTQRATVKILSPAFHSVKVAQHFRFQKHIFETQLYLS